MPKNLGLDTENLRHEFRDNPATIDVVFSDRHSATLVWPAEHEGETPFAYLRPANRGQPTRPKEVEGLYPQLGLVPVLSPMERTESVLADEYVRTNYESPITSRHARNHLLQLQDSGALESFFVFARPWLREIEVKHVRRQYGEGESRVDVFFLESGFRAEKEIAWLGDGMQVWLQLLFHLYRLRHHDVVVLDEPDVYLHADLKRRLVRLLESLPGQFVMASHSSEILAEVDQGAILYVDRTRNSAIRAKNPERLEMISRSVGSAFNLRLAKALRAKLLLFVEGDDMRILTLIAHRLGLTHLANEEGLAVVPLGGFDAWREARGVIDLLGEFLEGGLATFVILDRDYRSDGERLAAIQRLTADSSEAHVWERKELESYLIEPQFIADATGADEGSVLEHLETATAGLRTSVFGKLVQRRQEEQGRGVATGTVAAHLLTEFDGQWKDLRWRLRRGPAKEIMKAYNQESGASVNARLLARNVSRDGLDPEMVDVLERIEGYLT